MNLPPTLQETLTCPFIIHDNECVCFQLRRMYYSMPTTAMDLCSLLTPPFTTEVVQRVQSDHMYSRDQFSQDL